MVIFVWIWTLNSISLIYMFILMPVPHSLDYCNFVVCFKIGKSESSNFVFLFRTSLSVSTKKPAEILIGIALNLGHLVFMCIFKTMRVTFFMFVNSFVNSCHFCQFMCLCFSLLGLLIFIYFVCLFVN